MDKLKPCPFCGRQAEVEQPGSARQSNIVECSDCGCRLESSDQMPGYDLSWNVRPIEDALRAENERLVDACFKWERDMGAVNVELTKEKAACDEFMNINEGLNTRITLLLERIGEHKETIAALGEVIASLRGARR